MTKDLIERLEKADAGSAALDAAIFKLFGCPLPDGFAGVRVDLEWQEDGSALFPIGEMQVRYSPPAFTTSLDAIVALAEREFPGCGWDVASNTPHIQACLDPELGDPVAKHRHRAMLTTDRSSPRKFEDGATPALALCIAILKAKEAEK